MRQSVQHDVGMFDTSIFSIGLTEFEMKITYSNYSSANKILTSKIKKLSFPKLFQSRCKKRNSFNNAFN